MQEKGRIGAGPIRPLRAWGISFQWWFPQTSNPACLFLVWRRGGQRGIWNMDHICSAAGGFLTSAVITGGRVCAGMASECLHCADVGAGVQEFRFYKPYNPTSCAVTRDGKSHGKE